ncbi:MAG: 50S ribosomal protein L3 [Candidatus Yonathbacteria bacterium RIFCSPHIGHO2_01_FULL_51_10]|uniref:50S ribosomal protein L3 n=1 Tax=Candidatus Yonathbacteria bacterium RIFCSPHIGHO2_01_FULL_51_10 TaxID=1802723 RepID=A0A1G2S9X3_9BACT|nr:MAG: 50S ribosomal protein L3 [Candidatus Yonathbacteria bacterium RIFCSPHIGHO2_01_FULL_51_10]
MKFILGTKENMVQFFDQNGRAFPATLLSATPATVTDIRTKERDGYTAVQIGSGARSAKNVSKAQKGAWKDLGIFKDVREFRVDEAEAGKYEKGAVVDASIFAPGDIVTISGITKGKGFQGVVKRHGFKGGPRSHGQKHSEREAGSIGATGPQRVFKGTRMAGRMGSDRVTVANLTILAVDSEGGKLLVSGAVPGRRGTLLELRG